MEAEITEYTEMCDAVTEMMQKKLTLAEDLDKLRLNIARIRYKNGIMREKLRRLGFLGVVEVPGDEAESGDQM